MKLNATVTNETLAKVDIEIPDDGIPATRVDSLSSPFKTDRDALLAYSNELEQLAAKYEFSSEELIVKAHDTVGQHNPEFERALTLHRRIRILRNA